MAITTKTRKDLKSYFVKNAIPTEGNFADLIDAQLNQSEDGVFKLAGEPLSVVAASGDQKRVLRLYSNYPAANPDWLISLNPAQKSGETSYRAGFGITDAPGNTRLFIDATTGNLGVGTNNPQAKLDVNGAARIAGDMEATGAAKLGSLRVTNAITPSAGNAETTGIMFPADPFGGAADRAWIRYHNARGGEKCTLEIGIANDGDDHILLNASGNVGIGIADPQAKLDVAGNARVTGGMEVTGTVKANRISGQNTLVLNDYQTVNPTSNVYLYSPGNDRDAWIYLDSGGTTSNWGIYHRQIDSTVIGLPQNSIGFVGGGASKLQAYISLQDGSASFAGDVALGGKHAFRANDSWLRLNQDKAFTAGVHTPGNFAPMALNVGGANDWGNPGDNNAWIKGTLKVFGDIDTDGTVGLGWARTTDNFNAPLRSGFYQKDNPTGDVPDTAHGWVHLIAVRHSNAGNHHQLQIASTYAENDKLYFRKIARNLDDNNRPAWNEVATVTNGVLRVGDWTLESSGNHLYIKRGTATVARFSIGNDRFNVFKNVNGIGPYFYYNQQGNSSTYDGSSVPP